MGDFLRLVLEIRVLCVVFERENHIAVSCIFFFFIRTVKSLQFDGRKKIAELRKYYLM